MRAEKYLPLFLLHDKGMEELFNIFCRDAAAGFVQ